MVINTDDFLNISNSYHANQMWKEGIAQEDGKAACCQVAHGRGNSRPQFTEVKLGGRQEEELHDSDIMELLLDISSRFKQLSTTSSQSRSQMLKQWPSGREQSPSSCPVIGHLPLPVDQRFNHCMHGRPPSPICSYSHHQHFRGRIRFQCWDQGATMKKETPEIRWSAHYGFYGGKGDMAPRMCYHFKCLF